MEQSGKAVCAERLHFGPGQMDYNAVLAAEHVSRYAFAAPLCAGKRVLDVACGEGYGAFMLAGQGATEVIGVDIAEEAISAARDRFACGCVEFLVGDALDLPDLLGKRAPFDVVVSFETVEHVSDPHRFLNGIRRVLAPGGVILVSCPNDALETARGVTNQFHVRTYTLADFQELTTRVLGPAACWYLGTPLQGIVITESSSPLLHNDSRDLSLLVDSLEMSSGHLLPAQSNLRVTPEICTFYLGIWGALGNAVHVAAPMSRQAYLESWWALEGFKERVAFLEDQIGELRRASMAEKTGLEERVAFLEEQIGELRRASMAEKAGLQERVAFLEEQIGELRQASMAEKTRLKERVAFLGEQNGELRRASMAEKTELKERVAFLEEQIAELRRASMLEKARLSPQQAHQAIMRVREIESSRGHRLLQRYYLLAGAPVTGPVIQLLRRIARRVLHLVRRLRASL